MRRRTKKDFTTQHKDMLWYVQQWTENLEHDDTSLTMSYGADGPEATFWHPGNRFMVGHVFEGVTG